MATIEQLEKQKQDLINNLKKIISDTAIPINDRAAIIKELSRAIEEIAEQINKMSSSVPNVGKGRENEKEAQQQRKEEIKEIQKVKKDLQPVGIPKKVEEARWFMSEVIKVYRLDLSKVQCKRRPDDDYISWSLLWETAKPYLIEGIKALIVVMENGVMTPLTCATKYVSHTQKLTVHDSLNDWF
jgi:hypothetical protein